MLNTLILVAVMAKGQVPPQYRDYPWMGTRRLADISKIDGIAIVRAGRRVGENLRPYAMMVDEVEVVDSPAFPKGAMLHVVAPARDIGGGVLYPLTVGDAYLLISMKGHGGKLRYPDSNMGHREVQGKDQTGPIQYLLDVQQNDSSEVAGLAVFHTHKSALPKAATPGEQLVLALVDSLEGASPDDALRSAAFLQTMRPPEFGEMETGAVFQDTDLTRRMRAMAEAEREPYVKAKILQVLMNWHILGVEGPFVRAVAAAGAEPWAFTDPRDDLNVNLGFGVSIHGYRPALPGGSFCVDAIADSKSPAVQYFFLAHAFGRLNETDMARLCPLLETADPLLQDLLLDRFARFSPGGKAFMPQYVVVNGERQIKDRAALVAHWQTKFAHAVPPPS